MALIKTELEKAIIHTVYVYAIQLHISFFLHILYSEGRRIGTLNEKN